MPINLQNHRTSNAKLFSVSGNKQKLHTATSFQKTQKANLKVGKSASGTGSALLNRMINNQSLAAAASNPSRRRHSLTGGSSTNGSPNGMDSSSRQTSPLRRSAGDCSPNNNGATSPYHRKEKHGVDTSHLAPPAPGLNRSSSHGRSAADKKKNMRRSRSFGQDKTFSNFLPYAFNNTQTATPKPIGGFLRRGSGDSARSNNTAPPASVTHSGRSSSTGGLPEYKPPESPRDALKAKRGQLRRNTLSADFPFPQTPPSSLLNITTGGLLSDDDEDDDDDCSLYSYSEEH